MAYGSEKRGTNRGEKQAGGLDTLTSLNPFDNILTRTISGGVRSVDDILRGLGRAGGAVLTDVTEFVKEPFGIGPEGWWTQVDPVTGQSTGSRASTYSDIVHPIAKSFANTGDALVDLSYVGNLVAGGTERANEHFGSRLQELNDDPFNFLLEHVGNAAIVGSVVSKPLQLGTAASRGAVTGAEAARGLRPLAGRGIRRTARGETAQAAQEAAEAGRRISTPQVANFTGDIIGHPYRAAGRKIAGSRPAQLVRNPRAFDPVTDVEKTLDNLGEGEFAGEATTKLYRGLPEEFDPAKVSEEGIRFTDDPDYALSNTNTGRYPYLYEVEVPESRIDVGVSEFADLMGEGAGPRGTRLTAEEVGTPRRVDPTTREPIAPDPYQTSTDLPEKLVDNSATEAYAGRESLGPIDQTAQSIGYALEDLKKSQLYQARFSEEARASRRIRNKYPEGLTRGTGEIAEAVKKRFPRFANIIGSVNVRRKWDPSRTERLLLRDLKNLGKRADAERWQGLIDDVQPDSIRPSQVPKRVGEVATGSRVVGQTLDPEGLYQRITRVIEEADRQAGGAPRDTILREMLPGVDPQGLYLLGLNAAERINNLPENSLTNALSDYLEMDQFADVNRRAQQTLAGTDYEVPSATGARYRIPEEELGVDLQALPEETRNLFYGAAEQYRRDLATGREPTLAEEGLIPEGGTRIGRAADEPTLFPTELDELTLDPQWQQKLDEAGTDADKQLRVVESVEERLRELEDSGRPLRRRTGEQVTYRNVARDPREVNVPKGEYTKQTGPALDEKMGVRPEVRKSDIPKGGTREVVKRGPDNEPILVTERKNQMGFMEEVDSRPLDYVYRAVSEEDWQRIKQQGYMDSAGTRNIGPDEGMVADSTLPVGYLPRVGEGRYLKIRVEPEDGWKNVPDGDDYIKTSSQVPIDRVEKISPVIEGFIKKSKNGNTLYRRRIKGRDTRGEPTKASMDRAFKDTPTGEAVKRWRKRLVDEKIKLAQATSRLQDLEAQAILDPKNAPVSARNLLTYAQRVAPEQAKQLRAMAEAGDGDVVALNALADELDAVPQTLEDLNSQEVYLAYLRDVKDAQPSGEFGPGIRGVSSRQGLHTRRPGGSRRRGTQTDIDYSRDFRARAYWQDAEFQSWFMARQADEMVHNQGLVATGKSRLMENGYTSKQIADMTPGQAQQAMERLGLRVYQPNELFGSGRKPARNLDAREAEWITPFVEQNLMKAIESPGWFEKTVFEGIYDPMLRVWKMSVLPLRVGWQVNNFAGSALLSTLVGQVSPFDYPKLLRASQKAVSDWNKGITSRVKIPLTKTYRAELVRTLQKMDEGSDQALRIQEMLDNDAIILSNEVLNEISSSGLTRGDFAWLNNSQFLRDMGEGSNKNLFQQLGIELPKGPAHGRNLRQTGREVIDFAYHMNETVDNMHRTMVYLDQMGKGFDHSQAMAQVVKTLGDYNKLTGFERRVIKRMYPFYPWMRHVTEVVSRSLHPSNIQRTTIFMHLISIFGEPNEWEEMLPEWARGHIYMGMNEHGDPTFMSTRGLNPFLDVFDPVAQPNMRGLLRPSSPAIQMGYEQLSGVSVLTGEPFSAPGQPYGSDELVRPPVREQLARNIPYFQAARDVYRDLMGQPLTRYGTGEALYFPEAEEGRSSVQDVQQLFGYNVKPLDVENMQAQEKLDELRKQEAMLKYKKQAQEWGGREARDVLNALPGIGG